MNQAERGKTRAILARQKCKCRSESTVIYPWLAAFRSTSSSGTKSSQRWKRDGEGGRTRGLVHAVDLPGAINSGTQGRGSGTRNACNALRRSSRSSFLSFRVHIDATWSTHVSSSSSRSFGYVNLKQGNDQRKVRELPRNVNVENQSYAITRIVSSYAGHAKVS